MDYIGSSKNAFVALFLPRKVCMPLVISFYQHKRIVIYSRLFFEAGFKVDDPINPDLTFLAHI